MKRLITSRKQAIWHEPVYCMALINPRLCQTKSIRVRLAQGGEGPIPHVHVYFDDSENPENCAYVRLDSAEYLEHHDGKSKNKEKHLNDKQKAEFIDIMNAIWNIYNVTSIIDENNIRKTTGYEAAATIWIDTYGGEDKFTYDEEGFPIMPDYSKL